MARSLLRQLEQIRRSETYDDAVSGVYTSAVAEPTISGSLEEDLNVVRTLVKTLKGTTDWFGDLGQYFDPTSCSGGADTKDMSLSNISGHTLDAKSILIAVSNDNSAAGWTVTSGTGGVLMTGVTTSYATDENRTGLPIFASTGDYYDEGGNDNVCRVDVLDFDTQAEFNSSGGEIVYAKLHDGSDNGGSGSGTDVYASLYTDSGAYTMDVDVTKLAFVYPQRKRMTDVAEHEWLRTDFVSSWEGDVELVEDISNLWSYTGASDNDTSPQPWTNTTANYALQSDPDNLQSAIDLLNDEIGDRNYTEDNYITDGDTITDSLDDLDQALKDVEEAVAGGVGEKYVEVPGAKINKNVFHQLPYSLSYTPESTAGREGKNMDVFMDGQLLAADTGVNGANADRDYGETTASGITFRFKVQAGRNITYIIRQ